MGKKLLNDKCLFKCKYGAVIKVLLDPGNLMHKDCSGIILTDKTQCVIATPIPVCPILTQKTGGQAPIPCAFVQQPGWNNADSKIKINGSAVLTVDSKTKCLPAGEDISLLSPSACFSNIGNVGSVDGVSDLIPNKQPAQKDSTSDIPAQNINNPPLFSKRKDMPGQDSSQLSASNEESNAKKDEKVGKCDLTAQNSNESFNCKKCETEYKDIFDHCEYRLYATCDYKECPAKNKSECNYFKTIANVNNDSTILRNNYQVSFSIDNKKYEELEKENCLIFEKQGKARFHNQAHHMISGKQILLKIEKTEKKADANRKDSYDLLKWGKLLKLAIFCGFDVNCAENCILLPSFEPGKKVENSTMVGKPAQAYEIMSVMGRQWHVGNHSYELEKRIIEKVEEFAPRSAYRKKNNKQYAFSHYVASVEEELADFVSVNMRMKQCWKKRSKTNKNFQNDFLNRFKQVMKNIETYLLYFKEYPKNSYPFFVSLESVRYAFDLPTTSKVVFIYKRGFSTKAALIHVTRYKKDNNDIKFNIQKLESINDNKTSIIEFIKLCGNSTQFVIDENINFVLLFKALGIDMESEFNGKEIGTLFSKNNSTKVKEIEKARNRLAFFIKVSMAKDAFSKTDGDELKLDDNFFAKCYYELMGIVSDSGLTVFLEKHTNELIAFLNQTQMEYVSVARVVTMRINNIDNEVLC